MKYLNLLTLVVVLLASSCNKSDTDPNNNNSTNPSTTNGMTVNVTGLNEAALTANGTAALSLAIEYSSGDQEEATLSVKDLPANVTASFSAQSGKPTFNSTLTLTSAGATVGSYTPSLVVTPKTGTAKEYSFTLNVLSAPTDCRTWMYGTYNKVSNSCADGAVLEISEYPQFPNRVYIRAMTVWSGIHHQAQIIAELDCSNMTFTVPVQNVHASNVTVQGSGKILAKNKLEITMTWQGNLSSGNCTAIYE